MAREDELFEGDSEGGELGDEDSPAHLQREYTDLCDALNAAADLSASGA